jgi:transketolase
MTHDADTLAINTIRASCMDAIQKANSGDPGTPMGVAPVAYMLKARVAVEQASTSAGTATSETAARSSGCTPSVPRHP